ncbi:outer membrane protein [Pseudohoeflea coraliihabitans]|uniref:Porin family protein n=1 Tax=Pseudohoeflea coraliihabitans TaxID=2860393 RepID=A0ABS6WK13_9HYPH|nr:outer membrane protein [Pseudohoeflea sp. DP4N28-3]MBW3096287.1 porin family protein [Pseudohoeflea sp. DP4N28-3]
MYKRVVLSTLLAAATGFAGPALAADLDAILYSPNLPVTQPVEIGNGWYLRGDFGYSLSSEGAASEYTSVVVSPFATSSDTYTSSGLSDEWSGGVGVGYRFTEYLRTDATVDFGQGRFGGTRDSATPCLGEPTGTTCPSTDSGDYTTMSLLANGYVDLGTYAGFTPYVGAGAGMARVRWGTITNSSLCSDGTGTCASSTTETYEHPGEDSWRFTYALMAGMSYSLSKNLQLDLGYRYQKINSGEMFGFDSTSTAAGASGTQAYDNGFEKHEIRAGLRYSLW